MTEQEIKQTVFQLLKKIAPDTEPEKLADNANIRQTLDIDSFDYLNFIVALDEKLNIKTPEEDYGKMMTLKNMVDYILKKIK